MQKLTKYVLGYAHGAEGVDEQHLTGSYCRGCFEATACVEKLAEYEGLEETGLLLRMTEKELEMLQYALDYLHDADLSNFGDENIKAVESLMQKLSMSFSKWEE